MGSEAAAWRETVRAVWQRRLAVLIVAVLGLALGFGFAQVQTPRWTASTQLVLAPIAPPAVLANTGIENNSSSNSGGALGLDLPADTQARAMTAPDLLKTVAGTLNLPTDAASVQAFQRASRAQAVTDNLYTVTTDGPSAQGAADRANGIAQAYLAQRVTRAKSILNQSISTYRAAARSDADQADRLQRQVNSARSAPGTGAQISKISNLNGNVAQYNQWIGTLSGAIKLVGTGSSIVAPANAADAVRSPKTARDAAFGLVIGLVIGVIGVLSVYHLSPRARTRDEVANAAGVRVLASKAKQHGRHPDTDPDLVALGVGALAALNGQRPQWRRLLVLGADPDAPIAPLAYAVAAGNADQGRPSIAVFTTPGSDREVVPAASVRPVAAAAVTGEDGGAAPASSEAEAAGPDAVADGKVNASSNGKANGRPNGKAGGKQVGKQGGPSNVSAAGLVVRSKATTTARAGAATRSDTEVADAAESGSPGASGAAKADPRPAAAARGSLGAAAAEGGVTDLVAMATVERGNAARRFLRGIEGASPELSELPAGRSEVPAVRAAAALGPVLRSFYQQVVVAGPLDDAASALLTGQCDAVLLVTRAGRDTRASIAAAAERVVLAGGDLVGVVVTETRTDDHSVGVPALQVPVDPSLDAEPLT